MRASYKSTYKRGWFGESHRHYLAAKGVRTGTGYFAKGNRESGAVKRALATPIGYGPDGHPIYPTKEQLGLPYAPKRQSRPVSEGELMQSRVELQGAYGGAPETSFALPEQTFESPMQQPMQESASTYAEIPRTEGIEVQSVETPPGEPEQESTGLPGAGAAAGFMDRQTALQEEKPAYPQIYAAKKEYFMVKRLPYAVISELSARPGVRAVAVENFLSSVEENPTRFAARQNAQMDARLYKWSPETLDAINEGIDDAFEDER